jgi:hypothetical protein
LGPQRSRASRPYNDQLRPGAGRRDRLEAKPAVLRRLELRDRTALRRPSAYPQQGTSRETATTATRLGRSPRAWGGAS